MDEKTKDRIRILKYINSIEEPVVSVSDIEKYSGADKLRVFPILYELYLNKMLLPCGYTYWGVPDGYFVRELNLKNGDVMKYDYVGEMNSAEEFQEYILLFETASSNQNRNNNEQRTISLSHRP